MLCTETSIFLVSSEEAGQRIDALLTARFPDHSRTYFQALIGRGLVSLNGVDIKKRAIPSPGDEIAVQFEPVEVMDLIAEEIPLKILFEDEHLLAVDKPSGMVVHPAPGHFTGTFVNALLNHCKNLADFDDCIRPGIVHRLDKETSGVLLAAKTTFAHQKLVALFSERKVEKRYLAVCSGRPAEGLISAPIGRHPNRRKEMAVLESGGKEAMTEVAILAVQEQLSMVLLRPRTGRTHQLRVHLKHVGHPILGDPVYGLPKVNRAFAPSRLLLHAQRLIFQHPVTQEQVDLAAPLPEDFSAFVQKFFLPSPRPA